jgi:hypothetical protein
MFHLHGLWLRRGLQVLCRRVRLKKNCRPQMTRNAFLNRSTDDEFPCSRREPAKKTKENTEMENIQISFDEKLLSEIDRAVSATRLSRSEIVNKAVMHRLRKKRDALFRDRMD